MRFMCSITKATDKHSEYVTIIAVPPQQLLYERALNITFELNYLGARGGAVG